ncbi:molybdenum cofactor guanylyltransferase MobA [Magnetospira thiophila]
MTDNGDVVGVVLAGGLSRRLGGQDKARLVLAGKPMLARVAERLKPQVTKLILNVNNPSGIVVSKDIQILQDSIPDHSGPLAGLLTALEWTALHVPHANWVVSVPTDTPFLPGDLVATLRLTVQDGASAAVAQSAGRRHPVIGLWPVECHEALRHFLVGRGERQVGLWADEMQALGAEFSGDPDPFFNLNTPEDLAEAQRLIGSV